MTLSLIPTKDKKPFTYIVKKLKLVYERVSGYTFKPTASPTPRPGSLVLSGNCKKLGKSSGCFRGKFCLRKQGEEKHGNSPFGTEFLTNFKSA